MKSAFLLLGVALLTLLAPVTRAQVVISEFMAANDRSLNDEDGQASDWIELYNAGATAVNLSGWFLTDDAKNLTKWRFPSTPLSAHGFLVVFASNKDRRTPGATLHTNFKLDAGGEYLALVQPDGTTRASEFSPTFPKQYPDVAYGIGKLTPLVTSNFTAKVLVPTDGSLAQNWTGIHFNDTSWTTGGNGVGYETVVSGFAVRVVKANVYIDSLDAADTLLATPSQQAATYYENAPVINYFNSGGGGNYGDDRPVPGLEGDVEDYVIEATATVTIPAAGDWTFGVSSDDGFRLDVGGFTVAYPPPRGPDTTVGTFHFNQAGQYDLRLVFYERGGGSEVEVFAAQGSYEWWDPGAFRLVGDTANGGLAVVSTPVGGSGGGSYRTDIRTDVKASMFNQRTSAYVRIPFAATGVAAYESLSLKVKYDDGFIAYLNGVPVAQRNAPASPAWNTPATGTHSGSNYELIDLSSHLGDLVEGANVLAIHGLNRTADSPAFLVLAELFEYRVAGATYGYLSPATPGLANVAGYPALAQPVQFTIPGGVITNTVRVGLFSANPPGTVIRYTLDNKTPTDASPVYNGTIPVNGSVAIRARAFTPGLLPGPVATEAYTLIDRNLATFKSRLPLVIINSYGQAIMPDLAERVPATITVIDTKRPTGQATLLSRPDYHGRAGLEGRGQTSWGFPKKPYNVELRNENDEGRDASLLGMPAESDWVLLNVYNDKTFMNDFLAHELFEQMGHYAVRRRYVEVFLNGTRPEGGSDPSATVTYDDYVGIYVLLEKIKVGAHRVDIAKLDATDITEPAISGGYMFKKDKDSPGDVNFSTSSGQFLKFHSPKGADLTQSQRDWLVNYLNTMEGALYGSNWRNPVTGYAKYLDPDSFVDNHWIVEFTKQIDGYRLSNYFQKDRGGRVRMEPIWDYNLSFGNADYLEGEFPAGWYWPLLGSYDHIWLRRLIAEPGDPDFNQKIIDRWSVLRTNVLNGPRIVARRAELAAYLDDAQKRDFTRWPRLGQYIWPNPSGLASAPTYAAVLAWANEWLTNRFNWIDSQFVPAPTISQPGGPIEPGIQIGVSAPQGTIYYTTDGTDPRASGGAVANSARAYSGPITLTANVRVVARARSGSDWSGPAAESYWTTIPRLTVTEFMYHPAPPPAGSTNSADDFQFIELANTGNSVLALSGFRFTHGVEFTFTSGTMGPGTRLVLVKDRAAFQSRYGNGPNIAGVFTNSLAHGGERLTLLGPLGEPVLDLTYADSWDPITDGHGFSLVITDEQLPADAWNSPSSWRRSGAYGGSPGLRDTAVVTPPIVVNEVLTHTAPPQVDAIELYNPNPQPVDVSRWYLTDDPDVPAKFSLPNGRVIPPHGFLVIDETEFNPAGSATGFALNALGDDAFLFSANAAGKLTGHMDGLHFGASAPAATFGRYTNSVGEIHAVATAWPTLGAPNSGPQIGPVVINEVHYLPADGDDEFIELKNLTDQTVSLASPTTTTNTWRLKGVGFDFPRAAASQIPPCGLLLVVGIDPAIYRTRHAVPAGVTILGPYSGRLDNNGEGLALQRPEAPILDTNGVATVPYVTVDAVHYNDQPPWPTSAAGFGPSLERILPNAYADDPANWHASSGHGSPGLENPPSQPPIPPWIDSVTFASGAAPAVVIRFTPVAQQGYVLQFRDAFDASGWQTLQNIAPPATSCPIEVRDPLTAGRGERYYRLVAP